MKLSDGDKPLRQQFPLIDLAWANGNRSLITAGKYKYYGSEIIVWDAASGSPVIGPIDAGVNLQGIDVQGKGALIIRNNSETDVGNSLREVFVPQKASQWLLALADRIVVGPTTEGDQTLAEARNSTNKEIDDEQAWKMRLLENSDTLQLKCMVGSDIPRSKRMLSVRSKSQPSAGNNE